MIELNVKDMTCGHCVGAVTRAVKSVDAAANVDVDLQNKRVRVESGAPAQALIRALDDAGYPAAVAEAGAAAGTTTKKSGCCCS
ncbi:MAG: heavy-metal-associated domain-containing protein [Burkholderiales bacterium]